MPLIRPGIRRLFNLALRRKETRPAEVDEEIALHLELRAQQLQLTGLSPAEARTEATRLFGHTDTVRAQLRAAANHRDRKMDFRELLSSLAQDVRYALRGLVRVGGHESHPDHEHLRDDEWHAKLCVLLSRANLPCGPSP